MRHDHRTLPFLATVFAAAAIGCGAADPPAADGPDRTDSGKADHAEELCLPDPDCAGPGCEPVCMLLGQEFVDVVDEQSCAGRCGTFAASFSGSCDCDARCDEFSNGCCDDIVAECAGGFAGDSCDDDNPCATGLGCTFEESASCQVGGVCTQLMACAKNPAEYCDCEGNTQFSGSENCIPTPFEHMGACDSAGGEGDPCDPDQPCETNLFCRYDEGDSCGVGGTCSVLIPCRQNPAEYCDCDGNTRFSGSENCIPTPFEHMGACEEAGGDLGSPCSSNEPCAAGLACTFSEGTSCQSGGVCEQPMACHQNPGQYCDCDGQTQVSGSEDCIPEPFSSFGPC